MVTCPFCDGSLFTMTTAFFVVLFFETLSARRRRKVFFFFKPRHESEKTKRGPVLLLFQEMKLKFTLSVISKTVIAALVMLDSVTIYKLLKLHIK